MKNVACPGRRGERRAAWFTQESARVFDSQPDMRYGTCSELDLIANPTFEIVPALAYHICLALPEAFTQPGPRLLALYVHEMDQLYRKASAVVSRLSYHRLTNFPENVRFLGNGPLRDFCSRKESIHNLTSMGQTPWDDIKILGHCSVSVCLNVCLCEQNGTISKFWDVPCSAKCVYSSFMPR